MEKREKRRIKKEIHINTEKKHEYSDDCVCSRYTQKFNKVLFDLLINRKIDKHKIGKKRKCVKSGFEKHKK